jgi:hypothetical protein
MPHSRKCNRATPIKAAHPDARENTSTRRQLRDAVGLAQRRTAALVAVARVYGLVPRETAERRYGARCPVCWGAGHGRSLVIMATQTGGRFECSRCGAQGSRPNELQRLAERQADFHLQLAASPTWEPVRISAALARLDAIVARHGDKAREVCGRLADALETTENEPNSSTPRGRQRQGVLALVPPANDDTPERGGDA